MVVITWGGDDFDQKIIDHVTEHLLHEQSLDEGLLDQQVMAKIRRAAESAKVRLSDHPYAMLAEEYLLKNGEQAVHLSLEISRDEYEAMITPYVDQTLEAAHIAMEGAGLSVADLNEILLVGGATRTPLISRRLESELALQPRSEVDPDLCVAIGAAIQGAVISGGQIDTVLVDVTPYTFGTSALDIVDGEYYPFKFVPLIRKNSVIPCTKSEIFYTHADNQTKVEIMVYQGEDEDAINNTEIGRFLLEDLSAVPAGNEIVTTFSLDLNGILQVSAVEKQSGKEVCITIDNAISRFEEEAMTQAQARISKLFDGEVAQENDNAPEQQPKITTLINKAETLMENAHEDDREDLVNMIKTLRDAMTQNGDVEAAFQELFDLIFYLES